jgi:NTE family protein
LRPLDSGAVPGPRGIGPHASRAPGGAPRVGLVLPGGGARGAYQVGVLRAIADLLPRDAPIPFRVISGTSAGAIIAASIAAYASRYRLGATSLERFWRNFHVGQVFRADTASMLRSGARWLSALLSGGRLASPPASVFDVAPLRATLARHVDFAAIRAGLDAGNLDALALNATAYRSALSVAFFECSRATAPWLHAWRLGQPATLTHEHLMASAAVPFLFPAVRMGEGEGADWYGDGAMRQLSPLSPAINLGADRLLIVGIRAAGARAVPEVAGGGGVAGPSLGQIFGFMLDTLFMDGIQSDLDRLRRDNLLIDAAGHAAGGLRRVDALQIMPSADFGPIAERHAHAVPRALRTLLRTMGAANPGGRTLLSYMLFEGAYTRELIALGHADAMARRDELVEFLGLERPVATVDPRRVASA